MYVKSLKKMFITVDDTFAHHFSPNTGLGSPIDGLERWNGANLCYSIKVELATMSLARALSYLTTEVV